MITTVPVRDLKDTARICTTVRNADGPVIVTKNGYAELVLLKPEEYDELSRAREKQRVYDAVARAEAEVGSGNWVSGEALFAEIETAYGL
jgi:PHD/YefM family antitoxin component YafN of YafNO toxin-antitoxin module